MTDQQLQALNTLVGAVVIAEVFLIFGLLLFRTTRMVKRRESVPLLQARDLLLFAFFAVITIATQISRATGIRFGDYPAWVVFTDLFQLLVGSVYLGIELFAIGRQSDADK